MQEHLYKHFEREGRTEILDDVSITLVDKTDDSDPTKRERERELLDANAQNFCTLRP